MRLDREQRLHLCGPDIEAICSWLLSAANSVSAVVLSDYAKGVVAPALIGRVVDIARAHRIPVVVDPKSRDIARYAGATVLTPNASEAAAITGVECVDDAHAEKAAKILRERARVEAVVLTRGAQGMTVYDPGEPDGAFAHVPTTAPEVFDVSGAGDTVVAALALALAAGLRSRPRRASATPPPELPSASAAPQSCTRANSPPLSAAREPATIPRLSTTRRPPRWSPIGRRTG